MISFLFHAAFPEVAPFIRIEIYGRDGGPDRPRHRIEVDPPDDAAAGRWLALTMPCVACGTLIHPIRQRRPKSSRGRRTARRHLYFAPTCPLSERLPCSRGPAARDEYLIIRRAIEWTTNKTHVPAAVTPVPQAQTLFASGVREP